MGLYEREIQELRQKCKEIDTWLDLPKEERLKLQMQIYSHTTKKGSLILQGIAIAEKSGRELRNRILNTGLLGDAMVVDVPPNEIANEKIFCEDQNKVVTRAECKERLSSAEHFDQCRECGNCRITRRLLVQTLEGRNVQD